MAGDDSPAEANVVSVKLPEFWANKPTLWFKQVEAAFRRGRITTSATKYDYVLVKLPPEILDSVADIVNAVDDETADPYEQLKARLEGDYGLSKWQQAARIVDHPGLGDGRPSALMSQLLALLPTGEKPGTLFQYMFLRHLPSDMRSILVASKVEDARALAEQADLLWDARGGHGATAHAVSGGSTPPRRRSPSRGGRSRAPTPGPDALCFYHRRFAERAHRCRPPCSWTGNAPAVGGN